MPQINNFLGERIKVELKGERSAYGVLSFFNFEQQVIHLNNYDILDLDGNELERGKFIVVNAKSWITVKVDY